MQNANENAESQAFSQCLHLERTREATPDRLQIHGAGKETVQRQGPGTRFAVGAQMTGIHCAVGIRLKGT